MEVYIGDFAHPVDGSPDFELAGEDSKAAFPIVFRAFCDVSSTSSFYLFLVLVLPVFQLVTLVAKPQFGLEFGPLCNFSVAWGRFVSMSLAATTL